MRRLARSLDRWQTWFFLAVLLSVPSATIAQERFIQHTPKAPLHEQFFTNLNPDMLNIALRVTSLMALMLFIWFLRQHPLNDFVEYRLLANLRGKPNVTLLTTEIQVERTTHPDRIQ